MFEVIKSLFAKKRSARPDIESLIHAYGALVGDGKLGPRDISELPATKEELSVALTTAIRMTPDGPMKEQLRTGYMLLADFQDLDECASKGINATDLMMMEIQLRFKEV